MYNNETIYNNLMTILRKEKEGKTITENQFNDLLLQCSWEIANTEHEKFERDQVSIDIFRSLLKSVSVSLTTGVGDFVSAISTGVYWHSIYAYHTDATYGQTSIDLVTSNQYNLKLSSDLLQPTVVFPIAKIEGDDINVFPTSITTVVLGYLEEPEDPYFDYYYDANDEIKYLTPYTGIPYTLQTGESYVDKDDGSVLGASDTIGSISGGDDADNKSTELWLPEGERYKVLYCILQKMGIALNEQDAVQYGMVEAQKESVR